MPIKPDNSSLNLSCFTETVLALLNDNAEPQLPALQKNSNEAKIVEQLLALRQSVSHFSSGDFSKDVSMTGFVGGGLKSLQANLRHLIWQVEMVAAGDFSQRIEFMGEFAAAFNAMISRLSQNLDDLKQQEELLTSFTESLKQEITVRIKAEEALRISEERYKTLSALDPLTGLYNRRHFFNLATSEISRIKRTKASLSLCMLDVDYFKKFNDSYGHLNGDNCLRQIARISSETLRQMDLIARYGGEEFIILLPETDMDTGIRIAERIRHNIETAPIKLEDGRDVSVTASIGIIWVSGSNITNTPAAALKEAIQEADVALYKAKADGRNMVVSSSHV